MAVTMAVPTDSMSSGKVPDPCSAYPGHMTARRWSLAWNDALFGPDGFYRTQSPQAHFATAIEGVPGTAAVLADALIGFMTAQGLHTFVDLGAGRGTLATVIADRATTIRTVAMDIRSRPDRLEQDPAVLLPANMEWVKLPPGQAGRPTLRRRLARLDDALVFAHEWLDVLPCEIVEVGSDGDLYYVMIDTLCGTQRRGGRIHHRDRDWCQRHWPTSDLVTGNRVEIGRSRDSWWSLVTKSLGSGIAIAVDYGHTAQDRPRQSTLAGYRAGRAVPPIPDGDCDLMAHVAMDSLGAALILDQRSVLTALGVRDDPPDPALAAGDPGVYLATLARRGAGAALLGPGYGDALWAFGRRERPARHHVRTTAEGKRY